MNLKDFIEETLIEITEGLEAANSKLNKNNDSIFANYILENDAGKKDNAKISFDIAVTSTKSGEGELKGNFQLFVVDAAINGNASIENSKVSRVKFEVSTHKTVGFVSGKR